MNAPFTRVCPSCGEGSALGRYCPTCGHEVARSPASLRVLAEKELRNNGFSDMAEIAARPTALGRLAQTFNATMKDLDPNSVLAFTATSARREVPRILDVVLLLERPGDQASSARGVAESAAQALVAAKKSMGIRRFGFSALLTVYVFCAGPPKGAGQALHGRISAPLAFWLGRPEARIVAIDAQAGKRKGGSNSVSEFYVARVLRKRAATRDADDAPGTEDSLSAFVGEHLSPFSRILREMRVALNPELIAHRIKNGLLPRKDLFGIVVASCVLASFVDALFGVKEFQFVDLPIVGDAIASAVFVVLWSLAAMLLYPLLKLFGGNATLRETVTANLYVSAIINPLNTVFHDAAAILPEGQDAAMHLGNMLTNLYLWPVLAALHDMGGWRMFGVTGLMVAAGILVAVALLA
jgi:hypothetical protein